MVQPQQNLTLPSQHLLAWYDQNQRILPWRIANPDPYAVWLSEVMLQQTTVKAVVPYFEKFLAAWPNVRALAEAPTEQVMQAWAGLGYYSRARNLHACAKVVAFEHQGQFPAAEQDLRRLPGIGPYTAAAISSIAFGRRAVVVDGNVERVVSRLFALQTPMPQAKPEIYALADSLTPQSRWGDFAQAMMDLGATLCSPRNPQCLICPLNAECLAKDDAQSYPRKLAKPERPSRRGAAFLITRPDGALLARTRPDKGLLGGMTELPTTEWRADFDFASALGLAPLAGDYRLQAPSVTHVFTHFALELQVFRAEISNVEAPAPYRWVRQADMEKEAWPTVMRKILKHL